MTIDTTKSKRVNKSLRRTFCTQYKTDPQPPSLERDQTPLSPHGRPIPRSALPAQTPHHLSHHPATSAVGLIRLPTPSTRPGFFVDLDDGRGLIVAQPAVARGPAQPGRLGVDLVAGFALFQRDRGHPGFGLGLDGRGQVSTATTAGRVAAGLAGTGLEVVVGSDNNEYDSRGVVDKEMYVDRARYHQRGVACLFIRIARLTSREDVPTCTDSRSERRSVSRLRTAVEEQQSRTTIHQYKFWFEPVRQKRCKPT